MQDEISLARIRGQLFEWSVRVEPWACRNATLDASPSYYSCYRQGDLAGFISFASVSVSTII